MSQQSSVLLTQQEKNFTFCSTSPASGVPLISAPVIAAIQQFEISNKKTEALLISLYLLSKLKLLFLQ